MRAIAILTALCLSLPAGALPMAPAQRSSCDNPTSDFDNVYCERKVYMQADSELNTAYAKLRAKLGPADRTAVLRSQRAWIRERDGACNRTDDENIKIDLVCAKRMTIDRTNWLNDRLRECSSSGCRSSRLRD
ncbi:lysozyme inhibitor LprI family protein [Sphingomonas hylomeconis]|uniref:Lysozyme inhibitor LprI family protein n=1 Tax=Sphingomonas hylomeconis TaxID=1395958 RepID=A0ABV7SW33_9SPHN|nr:lysozyme inhibitor LprI family protein [Sphingomonas hylomeconis]